MYDVIIVVGGVSGLSAAVVLGRCRRRVLLCDTGRLRNAASHGVHAVLSRDGIRPRARSRTLVIATGVPDRVPSITNIRRFYGRSVFHCPYCDGWELRDGPLAAYGRGDKGLRRALALREERVARLDGTRGQLHGGPGERRAHPAPRAVLQDRPRPDVALAADLGCRFAGKGHVRTDTLQGTHIDGLWVVGDASPDVKLAMLAAADGVTAAFAINEAFAEDETR